MCFIKKQPLTGGDIAPFSDSDSTGRIYHPENVRADHRVEYRERGDHHSMDLNLGKIFQSRTIGWGAMD